MKISQTNWLKRLNSVPSAVQGQIPQKRVFSTPPLPQGQTFPTPNIPWQTPPSPTQQVTGRVGGAQTTAFQTQPLSAMLGWLNPSQKQLNLEPLQMMMKWLAPYLAGGGKNVPKGPSQSTQGWTQSLPQNMTQNLLRGRRR